MNLNGGDFAEDIGVGGRLILIQILKKGFRMEADESGPG
jgi:hypothetical protein